MDIEKLNSLNDALVSIERSYESAVSRGDIEDTLYKLKDIVIKGAEWRKELLEQLKQLKL
jgi:hypothetical protein